MTAGTAISLRRAGFVTLGLACTGTAHALTSDDVHLTPLAPLIWFNVFAAVFLLSKVASHRSFTPWGPARTLGALAISQMVAHVALDALPWTLGLREHHRIGLAAGSIVIHLCAAALIGAALRFGDRLLARLVHAIGLILTAAPRRPRLPRAIRALIAGHVAPRGRRRVSCVKSRGPPAPIVAA